MRVIVGRSEIPERTLSLHAVALQLLEEGELLSALDTATEALELLEGQQGSDSLAAARLLNTLGMIQLRVGRLRRAEAMANRARMIVERLALARNYRGDVDDLRRAHLQAIENLAEALRMQGRLSAAESVHRRTLGDRYSSR
jgi:tetratricopeptide (TPR) repeat protein